ncbi:MULTISPECIES: lysine--tRNA ligase [Psychrobacter]|jgi:lysyl-tRNA synthetase class 2|uniref:Lysine--tRNA ligase n=2 Tax=Psychrobacter TaxID=497 RepID=A0A1G6Z8V5_9GAMM|nr:MULTISPECIES: lysine--tRNA ligase [Psychrobacter]HBD03319.1 lysine--tRNA ligase [Psychrobacter sp.]MBZ1391368.1 lysine--tRNA ligase [Psychrobacter pacificensis]MDH4904864.1 lysine--tRNA ligase [Psychrobacter pocilloporae]SDD98206.1 lysyl-tRNA synthetase, class II [Psychrobacter pacificensis]GLR29994.1 lysine--tRNA ligase [Psychrobacter pacificensis]|tara:strand:- start:87 stop:1613 length:1527 start_codon:yes stop_codon:yes gene_type:complete
MSTNNQDQTQAPEDTNELIAQLQAKLDDITASDKQPYPNTFKRTHYAKDLQTAFDGVSKQEIEEKAANGDKTQVNVAGRVMLNRGSFIVIQDMTGRIQLYVARKELDEETRASIKSLDLGDIVGVSGYIGRSGKGDLYVHIEEITLLTKTLRPMPNKFHGLADVEARYRNRHLDLMTNETTRDTFMVRSQIVSGIRQFMLNERFMEVETPMMHPIPGGAVARPFETHHNALDMPLYLRIAPELYLKRLVVGGFERVFEINRSFRNEGVSTRHNPEFTMIEFYQAYADYHDLMDLTERMFNQLAIDVLGTTEITYQEEAISLKAPFARLSMSDAIAKYAKDFDMSRIDDRDYLAQYASVTLKQQVKEVFGVGKLKTIIFEETAEHQLRQPTFITEYPAETSPLARRNDDNPEITDRFELFIGGRELANGFSELNDPADQAERFRGQVAEKDAGDDEAMHFDEEYIEALSYGLPPTAGEGIGIDRLVMLFTDSASIRDVILFPHMRRKHD